MMGILWPREAAICVEDMARVIDSTLDIRDKAIVTLLAKTGIRRNELGSDAQSLY